MLNHSDTWIPSPALSQGHVMHNMCCDPELGTAAWGVPDITASAHCRGLGLHWGLELQEILTPVLPLTAAALAKYFHPAYNLGHKFKLEQLLQCLPLLSQITFQTPNRSGHPFILCTSASFSGFSCGHLSRMFCPQRFTTWQWVSLTWSVSLHWGRKLLEKGKAVFGGRKRLLASLQLSSQRGSSVLCPPWGHSSCLRNWSISSRTDNYISLVLSD